MSLSRENAERLEKVIGQVEGLYEELSLLSKKNPSDLLNTFKVGLLNSAIASADVVLGAEYKPVADFTSFEQDMPPSTSDAVFVISQYRNELERLRLVCSLKSGPLFELVPASDMELRDGQEINA